MSDLSLIAKRFTVSINYPEGKNSKTQRIKLQFICTLVKGSLFKDPVGREHLLPAVLGIVKEHFRRRDQLPATLSLLGDVLTSLSGLEGREDNTYGDVLLVVRELLLPLLDMATVTEGADPVKSTLVSTLLGVLRLMTQRHYEEFRGALVGKDDEAQFITLAFDIFHDLVVSPAYPSDWHVMMMLQNDVILSVIQALSKVLPSLTHTHTHTHTHTLPSVDCAGVRSLYGYPKDGRFCCLEPCPLTAEQNHPSQVPEHAP